MISAMLIHDRGTTAWIIVAAYFLGAIAAFWASRAARKRERRFWIGTAILLVLLGLNKELDLQVFLTEGGRDLARAAGVYEYRRDMQGVFLLALGAGGILVILALLRWLRRSPTAVKCAAIGISLLMIFIFLRASSFHHLDAWVTVNVAGLRSGWWLELAGIVVVAASALAFRSGLRRKSR